MDFDLKHPPHALKVRTRPFEAHLPRCVPEQLCMSCHRAVPGPPAQSHSNTPLCGAIRQRAGLPAASLAPSSPAAPRTPLAPARRAGANPCPPATAPGVPRASWPALQSPLISPRPLPSRVAGDASTTRSMFCLSRRFRPSPSPAFRARPPIAPSPTPTAAARLSLSLRPPPRFLRPPFPPSRGLVGVCAQAHLCTRRANRRASAAPPPPRRGPHHRSTPAAATPGTHTLPLSHHSHHPPHPSPPRDPILRLSSHIPPPLNLGATSRAAARGLACGAVSLRLVLN